MNLLPVTLCLALATLVSSNLLEMSQVLWTRVLGGGYKRIGKLDPLQVPVIKVDQAEGNTSYRVILRNLVVTGLNASTIESVHIIRGRLKSNLSDGEAGYVSYNEQRDLDSIRYRFHTLVKESKPKDQDGQQGVGSDQFERIVEFDPMFMRVREEEHLLRMSTQDSQQRRYYGNEDAVRENRKESQEQQQGYNRAYGDMRVAVNSTPRNPSSVRLVYTHNYRNEGAPNAQSQEQNSRPCIGACRRNQDSTGKVDAQRHPSQQEQYSTEEYARTQTRIHQDQRHNADPESVPAGYTMNAQFGKTGFSVGTSNGQQQSQFAIKGDSDSGVNYSGNYRNGQISVEGQGGENGPRQYQFAVNRDGNSEVKYSGNYRSGQLSVESNAGEYNGQRQNQFSVKGGNPNSEATSNYELRGHYGGSSFSADNVGVKGGRNPGVNYSGNNKNGQLSVEAQSRNRDSDEPVETTGRIPVYYRGTISGPLPSSPQPGYLCNDDGKAPAVQRRRIIEQTTPSYEEFEAYKAPMVRIEKQPGYVDIVYASEKQGSESRSANLKAAPGDPRVYALEEIMKDLSGNQRYIIHNFTEGESLFKRNNAARVSVESKRIKDLLRYAKNYQETQGYFEEGMELIYHLGNLNGTSKSNDTLTRRKRQHADDKLEDDVMHVVVRIRVPQLSVKSGYALMGKVGRQLLRGNGLLTGNFSNVTADFTVELKKVDNKTMIVRAARAKLVSADRKVNLQGMDDQGPVKEILSHGLMAAEAVAAMIADDLATKALTEGNADGVVYKMYKNLPVVEKS